MIVDIGNIIIDKIKTLSFMDKYAGVVKPITYSEEASPGRFIKKVFPASCNITTEQCKKGDYMDLCPDSTKKSVVYLEDKYIRFVSKQGDNYKFQGGYDLICWLNLPKLGLEQCSVSGKAMLSIISKFSGIPESIGIFQQLLITPQGEYPKSQNPFSKYSYDEATSQFLLYPYDYFVLPIQVDFIVNKRCISDFMIGDPLGCITPPLSCCDETPVPSPYLTCTTLANCQLIIDLIDRIDALESATPAKLQWIELIDGVCDGSNQQFTFANAPEFVFYNKVILLPGEYTIAGNTVTLTFVPFNEEIISAQATY